MAYDHKGMGIINLLWSGISIILILITSIVIYKEELTMYDIYGSNKII